MTLYDSKREQINSELCDQEEQTNTENTKNTAYRDKDLFRQNTSRMTSQNDDKLSEDVQLNSDRKEAGTLHRPKKKSQLDKIFEESIVSHSEQI